MVDALCIAAECKKCEAKFRVSSENLVYQEKHEEKGQSIYITYYDCPECGARHYVQIDDDSTLELLNEANGLAFKLNAYKKNGKGTPRKQSARFKKIRKLLEKRRHELMAEYDGTILDDNAVDMRMHMRFSV